MNAKQPETTLEEIAHILMGQLDVTREQITPESRIKEDLGADSLDVVEIVMKLEEEFEITIPDELAERVETVGDAHKAVIDLLGHSS